MSFSKWKLRSKQLFLKTEPGPRRMFAQLHLSGKLLLVGGSVFPSVTAGKCVMEKSGCPR